MLAGEAFFLILIILLSLLSGTYKILKNQSKLNLKLKKLRCLVLLQRYRGIQKEGIQKSRRVLCLLCTRKNIHTSTHIHKVITLTHTSFYVEYA